MYAPKDVASGQYLTEMHDGYPSFSVSLNGAKVFDSIPSLIRGVFMWGFNFARSFGSIQYPNRRDYIIVKVERAGYKETEEIR
jgi:hypothetical protein